MKNFPTEYSKQELLDEINISFQKLSDEEVLNTGARNSLITRIQIAQLQLTNILNEENTERLNTILKANKSSSRNTLILSIFMIFLAITTIFQTAIEQRPDYSKEIMIQTELLKSIENHMRKINVPSNCTEMEQKKPKSKLKQL